MTPRKSRKPSRPLATPRELAAVYAALRSYCRRERADDGDPGSPEMAARWAKICRMVGVEPSPDWTGR